MNIDIQSYLQLQFEVKFETNNAIYLFFQLQYEFERLSEIKLQEAMRKFLLEHGCSMLKTAFPNEEWIEQQSQPNEEEEGLFIFIFIINKTMF